MKQYIVFLACWVICGNSFLTRKYTVTGSIFLGMMIMHFLLLLPILLTHFLIYIWLCFIGWGFLIIICVYFILTIKCKCCLRINRRLEYLILILMVVPMYILYVLFFVPVVSRYYVNVDYLEATMDVFDHRRTNDYIDDYVNSWRNTYFAIQQFFFWVF